MAAITSGASEEPPIPHKTTSVKLLDLAQALNASNWGSNCLDVAGRSIQFNLMLASAAAACPHNVESLFNNFGATPCRTDVICEFDSSDNLPEILIYFPATVLTESISSSQADSNFVTPSTSK